ncbi:hypothetical protein D9M73_223680 [compost metagenome]
MPRVAQVVVAGEVHVAATAHDSFRTRQTFVQLEKRIGQAKARGPVEHDAQMLIARVLIKPAKLPKALARSAFDAL